MLSSERSVTSFLSSTMRKIAEHGKAPFLPEEIMRNILIRLPVKSLIRFQCVCKDWKNLFKTQPFISDHLHHASLRNPSLLLQRSHRHEPLVLRLIDCEMGVHEVQIPTFFDSLYAVRIIGSSNGLLCVAIDESDSSTFSIFLCNSLLLWNPATREVRQIPRTRTVESVWWDCLVGFGFSEIVNDYKIVKIYTQSCVISVVEVYSLSSNSWKEMELKGFEGVFLFRDAMSANGSLFWKIIKAGVEESSEDETELIMSFDIAMEVFRFIPCPPLSDDMRWKLIVYEDKLAVLSCSRIQPSIDLWVLKEAVGSPLERWSWTKKYSSNSCSSILDYLGAILGNEIVCGSFLMPKFTNESGGEMENYEVKVGLYLFDIITNECKMFSIPGYRLGHVFNHVESLVPVDNILKYEEP